MAKLLPQAVQALHPDVLVLSAACLLLTSWLQAVQGLHCSHQHALLQGVLLQLAAAPPALLLHPQEETLLLLTLPGSGQQPTMCLSLQKGEAGLFSPGAPKQSCRLAADFAATPT